MKLHIHTIYKLHGINALPNGAAEVALVTLTAPILSVLLTAAPEPHLTEIDRARAVANQLLKGLFAPDNQGAFDERLAAEIAVLKEARANTTTSGVFAVFKGEADISVPAFKARRDTKEFGISLDDISKDEIRERFRPPVQAVLSAMTLSVPAGSDLEFEKVGEVIYVLDDGSTKPIYVLNVQMGSARLSVARPLTDDAIGIAAALAARLNAETGSLRTYSLLRTSLDRATNDLQGFIAAWSALEIFVNENSFSLIDTTMPAVSS
jgi:hypothetical protein